MSDVTHISAPWDPRKAQQVLWAGMIGMLATGFPFTIVTVALNLIADDFGVSEAFAAWTVSAPMLVSAATLPVIGKLGDLFGHRRIFIWGILGSTVFAFMCMIAWDIWSLIAFRILSMVLAGATGPSAMAILFHVFPPEHRNQAIGWWSMAGPGAAALGLILGGPFIELFNWRSVFLVQAVAGFGAVILAWKVLPETEKQLVKFDHIGNLILLLALSCLLFVIGAFAEPGVSTVMLVSAGIVGVVGLIVFLFYEASIPNPIVPPSLLKQRNFDAPAVANFFMQMSYLGAWIATPLVFTGLFGCSIAVAAVLMLTRTFSLTLASPLGGVIATQFGERTGTIVGVLCQTAGLFTVAGGIYAVNLPVILLGLVLQGVGHGIAMPPLASVIATAVPSTQFGMASGMSRLMGQIGSAFGLSLFGVFLTLPRETLELHMIFVIGAAIALAAALPAALISMKHRAIPQPPAAPPPPNPPIQPGQV